MAGPGALGAGQPPSVWPDSAAAWVGRGYEERWETQVMQWPWTERSVGSGYTDWTKILACPRCGHQMSVTVGPAAYRDAASATSGARAGEVAVSCNCSEAHAGRPDKKPRGCGYGAWIPGPPKTSRVP
jgi:hypothetical protein